MHSITCNNCGYDMHDRKVTDLCPECSTPLDIQPDAYESKFKLLYPIALALVAILIMPFAASFSILLMIPSVLVFIGDRTKFPHVRYPQWAIKALRWNQLLVYTAFVEFWLLTIIHSVWPDALNWW